MKPFDPRLGVQKPSTGTLGGLFILAHILCHAILKQHGFPPAGGPAIQNALGWMPDALSHDSLRREFFDLFAVLVLGVQFMIIWEFSRSRAEKLLLLVTSGFGLYGAWSIAWGATWFFDASRTVPFLWPWTQMELVYLLAFLGTGAIWVVPLVRWIRQGAPLRLAPVEWALRTSFFRWAAGLPPFLIVLLVAYSDTLTDRALADWRPFCNLLFNAYLFLGLPYAFVTNLLRGHKREDRRDPGFVLLLIYRTLTASFRTGEPGKERFRRVMANRNTRATILDLAVKLFFVPFMVMGLYSNTSELFLTLKPKTQAATWRVVFDNYIWVGLSITYVVDVSLGLIGYVCSSRWLANKSVSVDSTLGGWFVALICYPPLSGYAAGAISYERNFGGNTFMEFEQFRWIDPAIAWEMDMAMGAVLRMLTLVLFAVYVWATMAFGLRFSNLTHRGIVTRGPYAVVRHPAYICKNLGWWTQNVLRFTSVWNFVFLAFWNVVYMLRAYTEERHLRHSAEYRAYCRRVKYMFIPGIW